MLDEKSGNLILTWAIFIGAYLGNCLLPLSYYFRLCEDTILSFDFWRQSDWDFQCCSHLFYSKQ